MTKRNVFGLAILALFVQVAHAQTTPASWEEEPPPYLIEDRMRFELSGFFASIDTQLRRDPSLQSRGTRINVEDDLSMAKWRVLPLAELTFLPGMRYFLRLSSLDQRRHSEKVLLRDIVFDQDVYFRNDHVDSEMNIRLVGLTQGYRLFRPARGELALTFTLQIADVTTNIVVPNRFIRQADSGVAPLPMVGIEGRWDLSSRWSTEGRMQILRAVVNGIYGQILDWRLAATWRANPHLLFGLGYRRFDVKLDSHDESIAGRFNFTLKGPELYLRASL
jgi:hypothetical protein